MRRIFLLFGVICFCASLKADLLDDVSRQLDSLEKAYWRSQYNKEGEYRDGIQRRMRAMSAGINRISQQLRQKGQYRMADISSPAVSLLAEYGKVQTATIQRFNLTFKTTSMRDYSKGYRTYLKEKEEMDAQKAGGKAKDGQKRRRTRSRTARVSPTLANVNMIEYERWLAEVIAENMEKFQSRKHNGNKSERDKMDEAVRAYLVAVKKLRIGLVKIRQQVKMEFK